MFSVGCFVKWLQLMMTYPLLVYGGGGLTFGMDLVILFINLLTKSIGS